jgi:hypothetical protein
VVTVRSVLFPSPPCCCSLPCSSLLPWRLLLCRFFLFCFDLRCLCSFFALSSPEEEPDRGIYSPTFSSDEEGEGLSCSVSPNIFSEDSSRVEEVDGVEGVAEVEN